MSAFYYVCVKVLAFFDLKVIKSARVMKKAVGYLIPFMEIERETNNKLLAEQGLKVDNDVSHEKSYSFSVIHSC